MKTKMHRCNKQKKINNIRNVPIDNKVHEFINSVSYGLGSLAKVEEKLFPV